VLTNSLSPVTVTPAASPTRQGPVGLPSLLLCCLLVRLLSPPPPPLTLLPLLLLVSWGCA
jgi:hypothetical protein